MRFNFEDRPAQQSSQGFRRTLRGVLTLILLALSGLAALEIVMFAQDYLHVLRG